VPVIRGKADWLSPGGRVRLWIDAQLPPLLAGWIPSRFAVEAANLDAIGLRQADDPDIFAALRKPGEVIMTKDDDFVDIVTRLGPPPQVLWVTCGNVTNRVLKPLLERALPEVLRLLESGEPVVELRGL
jgi:predicted nuclease of predicted toxin-antitoxin system